LINRRTFAAVGASIALAAGVGLAQPVTAAATAYTHYKNCTALNAKYKHGVGRKGARDHVRGTTKPVTNFYVNTGLYNANKGLDRDKDGIACEKR
jgi:hypothetical protein